jgi:hypothetical protein
MARRPVPPAKPKTPTLTAGQKARRVERLQKCITKLEAFDPQKARKRAPAILELKAAIDKALSSASGYGTPLHLRYNQASLLDPSPLLTKAAAEAAFARPVSGPAGPDARIRETREQFSEKNTRAITLLQSAIRTLGEEITNARAAVVPQDLHAKPVVVSDAPAEARQKEQVETPTPNGPVGFFASVRDYVARWWRRARRAVGSPGRTAR